MFLGDHTSPDDLGYVGVVSDVLTRFHPSLKLRLISAGAKGQTATGLASTALMNLLGSSRPEFLVIALGLTDASREPQMPGLLSDYRHHLALEKAEVLGSETLGPLTAPVARFRGPVSGSGQPATPPPVAEPGWQRLPDFASALEAAVGTLAAAGVSCVLVTPPLVGTDPLYPLNLALSSYARAIRLVAQNLAVPVVDFGQSCRDLIDRAANYNQSVEIADLNGRLNHQGQTLLARTFVAAAGLLPQPGFRRRG